MLFGFVKNMYLNIKRVNVMEKRSQETNLRCSDRHEKVLGYRCFRVGSQQARQLIWQHCSEKVTAMLVKSEAGLFSTFVFA